MHLCGQYILADRFLRNSGYLVDGEVLLTCTADERQPWMNYENNGNEYFTIGAVVRSE